MWLVYLIVGFVAGTIYGVYYALERVLEEDGYVS